MRLLHKHTNKHGQIEMVGLVIVVVLITLGVFFVIKFAVIRQPSTAKQSFTMTQLSSNTVNAMLMTETECREFSMSDLIGDCVSNPPYGEKVCSGTFSSSTYANTCTTGYNVTFCKTQCEIIRDRCVREYTRYADTDTLDIDSYITSCSDPATDAALSTPLLDSEDSYYPNYLLTAPLFTDNTFQGCVQTCESPDFTQPECETLFAAVNASIRSCDYVTHNAKYMLENTLGLWRQKYRFTVYQGSDRPKFQRYDGKVRLWIENNDFSSCKNIESKTYPLPYSRLPIIVQMELCSS